MTVTSTSAGFQPAFPHVAATDRHSDVLAAVAIVASTTLEDVFKKAEELGLPKTGPYYPRIDGDFLAKLAAKYSWVAGNWVECSATQLPGDLCLALVDYDATWEIGRYVVIHKAKASHDGTPVVYAIDPSATDPKKQVRVDLAVLKPAWALPLHVMGKPTAGAAKK
jgi:hypothetical protein